MMPVPGFLCCWLKVSLPIASIQIGTPACPSFLFAAAPAHVPRLCNLPNRQTSVPERDIWGQTAEVRTGPRRQSVARKDCARLGTETPVEKCGPD